MPRETGKCHDSDNGRLFQLTVNQCQMTLIALLLRNTMNYSLGEALEGQHMLRLFQEVHEYDELVEDLAGKMKLLMSTIKD